jgi:hypothetical protein
MKIVAEGEGSAKASELRASLPRDRVGGARIVAECGIGNSV